MGFCVYQVITKLMNLAYQNMGHAHVVTTNLKQIRLYNLTMSYGSSFYWLNKNLTTGSNTYWQSWQRQWYDQWARQVTRSVEKLGMKWDKWGLILGHPAPPPSSNLCKIASGLILKWLKRLCIMLVCEWTDACISICMVTKSSNHRSSYPIPSVEFFTTNSPEDEGKLFIHSNPLEQVCIIYTRVTKLSMVERLVLLHLLGATVGNVIAVCGHRNVIVCKIADWPPDLMRWRHERWR
jgi:hypothetical protein